MTEEERREGNGNRSEHESMGLTTAPPDQNLYS